MQFEALDRTMRVYETAHDHRVLPGLWMVARLDGRSFTRLVRAVAVFDDRIAQLPSASDRAEWDSPNAQEQGRGRPGTRPKE